MNEYDSLVASYIHGDQTALYPLCDYCTEQGWSDQAAMWRTIIRGRSVLDRLSDLEEDFLFSLACFWVGVRHRIGPTDRAAAEQRVDQIYRIMGANSPHKQWVPSPQHLANSGVINTVFFHLLEQVQQEINLRTSWRVRSRIGLIRGAVREHASGHFRYRQHDAGWFAYYHAFALLGLKGAANLIPYLELAQHCSWCETGENRIILIDLPVICLASSVIYADGFEHAVY